MTFGDLETLGVSMFWGLLVVARQQEMEKINKNAQNVVFVVGVSKSVT